MTKSVASRREEGNSTAVGYHIWEHALLRDLERCGADMCVVLTDTNVFSEYGERIRELLTESHIEFSIVSIPAGESFKTRMWKETVEDRMLRSGASRASCLVCFGGGVVGDLGGFVASTFMRGIALIHVPTSLLAMVDSSIGSKTAVDTSFGKNLVGTFYTPFSVIADLELLSTLPSRHWINGMAEIIKIAAMFDVELFQYLEHNVARIEQHSREETRHIIERAIALKENVVREDHRERSKRALLNFGHTFGHAIESACLQQGILHGEAVSIGMVLECDFARELSLPINASAALRLTSLLTAYQLPTTFRSHSVPHERFILALSHDKKNTGTTIGFVFLETIGKPLMSNQLYVHKIDSTLVHQFLNPRIQLVPNAMSGRIRVPPSKSITNRAFVLAALAKGTTRLNNVLISDDTKVMIDALRQMGIRIELKSWSVGIQAIVYGCSGNLKHPSSDLYMGNSGTSSRFLLAVCALLHGGSVHMKGNAYMSQRPIGDLANALEQVGCKTTCDGRMGSLPLTICPQGVSGGCVRMKADTSSQFVSALLLIAPYAQEPIELCTVGDVVSAQYIDMTIAMMKAFGARISKTRRGSFLVSKGGYIAPESYTIEGDASSAAYPLSFAAVSQDEIVVENVGSQSLQGDAGFGWTLNKMGCYCKRGPKTMAITGEGFPFRPIDMDFSLLTDSFLVAACLCAFTNGTSYLRNIANQRKKECNRLEAVVSNLKVLGVDAEEIEDGLYIKGIYSSGNGDALETVKLALLSRPAVITCHGDHRIAMAFSIFGAILPNVILDDKTCVSKTYQSYWTDMYRLGLRFKEPTQTVTEQPYFLVGMRGAGKSFIGSKVAAALGRPFIDADDEFKSVNGMSIQECIQKHGWNTFRYKEYVTLVNIVTTCASNAIIACGGGVVESAQSRGFLLRSSRVIWIHRSFEDTVSYLHSDSSRVPLGEDIAVTWKRRHAIFREVSDFIFDVVPGTNWNAVATQAVRFMQGIEGERSQLHTKSFFLSLTLPQYTPVALERIHMEFEPVDALEIRFDCLRSQSLESIPDSIRHVRRFKDIPIIFTVRSTKHGGQYAGSPEDLVQIYRSALKTDVELVDIEADTNFSLLYPLVSTYGRHRLLASMHFRESLTVERMIEAFEQCYTLSDLCKVVTTASCPGDSYTMIQAMKAFKKANPEARCIGLAMGPHGKLTRVQNKHLTPVTCPGIMPAARGQMTYDEVQAARRLLGYEKDASRYFLFGKPIEHSPSPAMHNAVFRHFRLLHTYALGDASCVDGVVEAMKSVHFGGASITIPYKQTIIPYIDTIDRCAMAIKAVNTIYRLENGKVCGTNTDWSGFIRSLQGRLGLNDSTTALVAGAGGVARAIVYALRSKNVNVFILNQSFQKAVDLAAEFGCTPVQNVFDVPSLNLIVNTLPASVGWTAPDSLLCQDTAVYDVNYVPQNTNLMRQAGNARCSIVMNGEAMLLYQAVEQSILWTGRKPPVEAMQEAMNRVLHT